MKSLAHQFLDFCRSKPADEEYDYSKSNACAFYQFATAYGIPEPDRYPRDLPGALRRPLVTYPQTFGALADRLEQALAAAAREDRAAA